MSTARANRLTPYMFMAPAAIIMAIALLYPLGYMIWGSFRDWNPSQAIGEAGPEMQQSRRRSLRHTSVSISGARRDAFEQA